MVDELLVLVGGQLQVQAPEGRFQTGNGLHFTLEELAGSIGDTEGLLEASWQWLGVRMLHNRL